VSRQWRIRLILPAVIFVAAVILLTISHPGDVPFGLGWGLVGVLGVVLVAYLFLAIGESEDRERRAAQRKREGPGGGPHR
jgi:hypothetical protein